MCDIAVSIIIPIYNAERHLGECLESCIHQSLNSIEIICINDGSTDHTIQVLEQYCNTYQNIILLNQENQGAGAARNLGIKYARGKYVAFMDSDDYYPDVDVLKKLYHTAIRENVKICGGSLSCLKVGEREVENIPVDFQFKEEKILFYKEYQHSYGFTRFIYNTDFIRANNIIFPTCRQFEDPPFMVDAMIKAEVFYVIRDIVYVIRNTDKVIRYKNTKLITEILLGIQYIMHISKIRKFEVLHSDMVVKFLEYLIYAYQLIYNGDTEIRSLCETILSEIDENLLNADPRHLVKPKLMSDEEIHHMINKSLVREKQLMWKIKAFKIILIYGAGRAGRSLYDFINHKNYKGRVEFVVSFEKPNYTACGKAVQCIQDYIEHKDHALVIIANKNSMDIMEENARQLQFKYIEKVTYDELKILGSDLINDNIMTIY